MTRFNGKQDLSAVQLRERANRRHRRQHWQTQPKGVKPLVFQEHQPVYRPSGSVFDAMRLEALSARLTALMQHLFPRQWWRR